jgi:hypothetical protein
VPAPRSGGSKYSRCAEAHTRCTTPGAELIAAPQLVGDTLQEGIATTDVERPGGRHDGVELGIGEANWHSIIGLRNAGCRHYGGALDGVRFAKGSVA